MRVREAAGRPKPGKAVISWICAPRRGKHVNGTRHEGLCVAVPGLSAERELTVRASGDPPPARRPRQRPATEEDGNLLAAAVPGWQGGIVSFASSASMAATAATSLRSQAVT